jgi:hypothetical protein
MADNKNTKGTHSCSFQYGIEYFNILVFIRQPIKIRKETFVLLSKLALNTFNILEFIWWTKNNTKITHCCHFHVSTELFNILVFIFQIIKTRKYPLFPFHISTE